MGKIMKTATCQNDLRAAERRKFPRVRTDNPITYAMINEKGTKIGQGIGRSANVSQSGILLETCEYIGSKYIFLVSTDLKDNLVEIVGKVVFSREVSKSVFNTGIHFMGEHEDNVKFRRELIRVFHRKNVLGFPQ